MQLVPLDEKELGITPLVIVSIVAGFLLILGVMMWLFLRSGVTPQERVNNIFSTDVQVVKEEPTLRFDLPNLDVTGPDLSPLEFADMEFSAPAPGGDDLVDSFTVDADFSLTANIAVTVPPVSFEVSVKAEP